MGGDGTEEGEESGKECTPGWRVPAVRGTHLEQQTLHSGHYFCRC